MDETILKFQESLRQEINDKLHTNYTFSKIARALYYCCITDDNHKKKVITCVTKYLKGKK